jgi:MFS family permease
MSSETVSYRTPIVFYGWIIVAVSMVMLGMLAGIVYTFGIFFKSLIVEFGWSRTAISGVLTTYWICHAIFAIPVGWISDRYGPRPLLLVCNLLGASGLILITQVSSLWQMYIFYGVMVGCGFAGTFVLLTATTARWFLRRRGLALGIVACGIGLGTMVMAPLVERLISGFGWRGAYLGLGIMSFATMVLPALLIYKEPNVLGLLSYGQSKQILRTEKENNIPKGVQNEDNGFSVSDIVHFKQYWIILAVYMLFFICMQMVMTHLYNYATDSGISGSEAASFISIAGGSSIIGRLGIGIISDRLGSKTAVLLCLLLTLISFGFVLSAYTVWMFYLFAIIFGLTYGGLIPLMPGITSYFFGLKSLGFVVGATMAAASLGGAIGPLLGGVVFDYTGSYRVAFALAAGLSLAGIVLTLLLRPLGQSHCGSKKVLA